MPKGKDKIWTDVENNQLIELRKQNVATRKIAIIMGVHYTVAKNQLLKLNIYENIRDRLWQPETIELIISSYKNGTSLIEIGKLVNKDPATISNKLKKLGLLKPIMYWSENEINILKNEISKQTPLEKIAKILGYSLQQVTAKKQKLKLKYNIYKSWTKDEINLVIKLDTEGKSVKQISEIIPRSPDNIRMKMQSLDIKLRHIKYERKITQQEIDMVIDLYVNQHLSINQIYLKSRIWVKLIKRILISQNIKLRPPYYRFRETNIEDKIKDLYTNNHKTAKEIHEITKVSSHFIFNLLKQNNLIVGQKERRLNQIPLEKQKEIIYLYQNGASPLQLSEQMSLSEHTVKNVLRKHHIKLRTIQDIVLNSRPNYPCGYSGTYKEIKFRSLNELAFMIYLDRHNIQWKSAENKKYVMTYELNNAVKNYFPDFIVENLLIVEIKPKRFWDTEMNASKQKGAIECCKLNNLGYQVIDFKSNLDIIKQEYKKDIIKFNERKKKTKCYLKFLSFINS